jgi:SNF2 family DNA or RNA helicase
MQIVDNKALVLKTRTPHKVTEVIPKSKDLGEKDGMSEVAVHWSLEAAQALVRIGAKSVPSPILRDYQWTGKLKPFAHQLETASFLTLHPRAYCLSEAGTAKTACVIWAADYLLNLGVINRVLVVCPLSIMKAAWQKDMFKFAMHRSCAVAHGDTRAREKVIESDAQFVIINFDGVAVVKEAIKNGGFDLIVIDELTAYKNPQTNRWKAMNDITKGVQWVWGLTGTPAAQSPLDAYGLAKLITPERVPKYFGAFRDLVMYKVSQFVWRPKMGSDKVVFNALQPAIRYEKKDCLDLPSVMYVFRDAPLTAQQRKYYSILKKKMVMEAAGESVTSLNAAVNINKLLQVSCGAVYSDTGEVIEFDVSHRLNVVYETIMEASHKVLVFVPFSHAIELLYKHLTAQGLTCGVIAGDVSANKRAALFDAFQTQPDPRVLIIQPQAAAHGVTLTAADTIVWYAPVTSVETYLQANARIDRPGQVNHMTVVNVAGSEVEERLYTLLQNKITAHTKIVELYRQEILKK